ncbi:PrpF domain-containing protein [uncultured Boseongicola sp.]|uniref:PrpF domain-containing protein n=1 Tax=uncultured Boseongicola sp. TaxID=1648499 RepID=UPI0026170954|nr:PrpF domain-containing protein [uncultured Boseongicola sp.]
MPVGAAKETDWGGAISTRTSIPHRCHKTIGILGGVSVATACLTPGAVRRDLAVIPKGAAKALSVEYLTGEMTAVFHVEGGSIVRAEVLRTARNLMDGVVLPTDKAVKGTQAVE